jgi:hypothetical protein
MKQRIADAHVHLEDVAEGKFRRPEKMLSDIKDGESAAVCAKWLEEMLLK